MSPAWCLQGTLYIIIYWQDQEFFSLIKKILYFSHYFRIHFLYKKAKYYSSLHMLSPSGLSLFRVALKSDVLNSNPISAIYLVSLCLSFFICNVGIILSLCFYGSGEHETLLRRNQVEQGWAKGGPPGGLSTSHRDSLTTCSSLSSRRTAHNLPLIINQEGITEHLLYAGQRANQSSDVDSLCLLEADSGAGGTRLVTIPALHESSSPQPLKQSTRVVPFRSA